MNTSLDYQIELVESFIKTLNLYSHRIDENIDKYQKHIDAFDNQGLVKESVDNLRNTYFENTKNLLKKLIDQIQNQDITKAKSIIEQLEQIKNIAQN